MSVLLANIWTCLQGNQTSFWFACSPLALEDYLQLSENGNEEESSSESEWYHEQNVKLETWLEQKKIEFLTHTILNLCNF